MAITNPKFAGRSLLLKIGDSSVPATANFTTIGSCRMSNLAINQQEIDTTDKDDDAFQKLLEGGVRNVQFTVNGLVTANPSYELMFSKTINGNIWSYLTAFGNAHTLKGNFMVTALTVDGDYKDGQKFTATLKSADTPVYV